MPSLVPIFPQFRRRKRRGSQAAPPTPPGAPLVLVSATYEVSAFVELTFDRAVDVSAIVPAAFVVHDGPTGFTYQGASVLDQAGAMVRLELSGTTEYEGSAVLLDVSSVNGVVAVDDGGTFAGVTDVELPFP